MNHIKKPNLSSISINLSTKVEFKHFDESHIEATTKIMLNKSGVAPAEGISHQ